MIFNIFRNYIGHPCILCFSEFSPLVLNDTNMGSVNPRIATCVKLIDGIRFNSNDQPRTKQVTCQPGESVLFKIDRFKTEKENDFFSMIGSNQAEIIRKLKYLIYYKAP